MTSVRALKTREFVGSSFWLIPTACVLVAVFLALVLPVVDESTSAELTYDYNASVATELLSAIAAGMIVFTGFVFSVVMLIVQFGSTQYSPRLLRAFVYAPVPKIALGTFVATFTYALLVLATIESRGRQGFVPSLSVTFAIVLVIVSIFMFLLLMQRAYQGLRPGSIARFVARRGRSAIDAVHPEPAPPEDERQEREYEEQLGDTAHMVAHDEPAAVLQAADMDALLRVGMKMDDRILLVPAIGDFVPEGAPLFFLRSEPSSSDARELRNALVFGVESTHYQDPGLALRWLVDISIKALSPAINDPTTAVQAVDQIEDLLRTLGTRRLTTGEIDDEGGIARVSYRTPDWEDYLTIAMTEVRQYGAGSAQIQRRLRALLFDLRDLVPAYRRRPIDDQLALLDESAEATFSVSERATVTTGDYQGIGSRRLHGYRRQIDPPASGGP